MNAPRERLQSLFAEAQALQAQGRIDMAITRYEALLAEAPDELDANLAIARLLQRRNRLDEAVGYFSRALQQAPQNGRLKFSLGYAFLRLGRHAEAAPLLESAAAQLPQIPHAVELAAYARFKLAGREIAEFTQDGEPIRFRIGEHNLGLDMFHVSGRFFETAELAYCRELIAPGGVIVDIGANVGNHLIYFAKFLMPARIVPIEPHPESVRLLRENIALNSVGCVDERYLGSAVAAKRSRLKIVLGQRGDLVLAQLLPAADGEIEAFPLDELPFERIDLLKVDVEGMEFAVLDGMAATLRRCRPILMIEVQDAHCAEFIRAMQIRGYRLQREFPGAGYKNLFMAFHD